MHRFRQLLVTLSLLLVVGAASARTAALVNPAPVAIPAGLSEEQVAKDIKRALAGRGWIVDSAEPGHIASTLRLRDHVAVIDITYDGSAINIAYVRSTNLDYKKKNNGTLLIHRNYLSWIDNIARDIAINLQLSQTGGA